jgi:glyceraldehyde 3-phosphate dehydrogenase
LDRDLGIQRAFATTIHAVTDSQNLLDNSHKKEVRLRRSAMACLIPTSSGAGKDVAKILPHLAGKIFLRSLRIPLLTVSLIDLTAEISKKTSKEEVNQVFEKEAKGRLRQIIEVAQEEFVSSDFIGNPHSAIFDPFLTEVAQGNLVKVFAWYDNEWAYAQRLVDLAYYIAKKSHLYEN